MPPLHEQAARLADLTDKLLNETVRLHRDVERLSSRLPPREPDRWDILELPTRRAKNFAEMFVRLDQSRDVIVGAERELAALRAHVAAIAEDVVSREEMQRWLIDPHAPRRPAGS